jgi:hypothetical protein
MESSGCPPGLEFDMLYVVASHTFLAAHSPSTVVSTNLKEQQDLRAGPQE